MSAAPRPLTKTTARSPTNPKRPSFATASAASSPRTSGRLRGTVQRDCPDAKLFEIEIKKREEKAAAEQAAKTDIGWGHQIRSYVLQPYQMVKDLRTGVSTSNTAGVLDGDLDEFMQAALAQKAFGGGPDQVEDVE